MANLIPYDVRRVQLDHYGGLHYGVRFLRFERTRLRELILEILCHIEDVETRDMLQHTDLSSGDVIPWVAPIGGINWSLWHYQPRWYMQEVL